MMMYLFVKGFLCVVISIQVLAITPAAVGASFTTEVPQIPAIYVFGDSTVDVGNNNYLPGEDVPRADHPYYGIDFPSSEPTGRFSNGYNIADFIAKFMGFESGSPPAYLSLTPQTSHSITRDLRGVNYASAGAGILNSTNAGIVIPLLQQVEYFAATKAQIEATLGTKMSNSLVSKSFFLISIGSNDLFAFAAHNKSASDSDVDTLYNSLAFYNMGARKFGIINVGPIGCVPFARFLSPMAACMDSMNNLAKGFDDHLSALMHDISSKMEGLSYSIADYYGLAILTLTNPLTPVFVNTKSTCCGGGRLGAESNCMPNSTLCRNRDQYVFWDMVHPSQQAAKLSASAFYINFKQLVLQF